MKIHYIAANRYHLSLIRPTEQGFMIDPLEHGLLDQPNELLLEAKTEQLGICQDEQQFIHMVYINPLDKFTHAFLHPTQYTVQFRSMDRTAKDVIDIQLGCQSNRLHLYIIYRNRIEYQQLSGIHWSEPVTLIESKCIERVQLQMNRKITTIGYMLRLDKSIKFCLLQYDHDSEQWSDPLSVYETTDNCNLYPLLTLDMAETLHIVLMQFSHGQLQLSYFHRNPSQHLHPIFESTFQIPLLTTEEASFTIKDGQIRCFWYSDHLLYQVPYHPSTSSWGPLQAVRAESIVKWMTITDHPSFGTISPYWLADSRSIHELNKRTGYGIDPYKSDRDFQQSLRCTERWISSALSMIEQKEQLQLEQQQLEQEIKHWKDIVTNYKARLLILNEELSIRQALARHTLKAGVPRTPVLTTNQALPSMQAQASNEHITDVGVNTVTLDWNEHSVKKSVRDKAVHFLFRITGNK